MSACMFKTEVKQLLDLMIHSLYSNKDIFLRELAANAADAIDKARFESLTAPDTARVWQIRIDIDKDKKTLTVSDNGVGMDRDEIAENLGTIAKSGTRAFSEAVKSGKDAAGELPELIGQFGVGFYSAFMVADKVEVVSKKQDCDAVRWSSTGEESFDIGAAERSDVGTDVILHLKDDAVEYLDYWRIAEIIRKYSDYIAYPIVMNQQITDKDGKITVEEKTLNTQKAIWLRSPADITEEEHQSFFSHLSGGGKYWKSIQMTAEGTNEFKALLYIPEKMPYNFLMPDFQKKGLQLYVKRVFITDECTKLIPDYLQFVKGVVDSSDLPLNVSREILQDNPLIGRIQKAVTAKVLGELKKLLESERAAYEKFFAEFGKMLKIGLYNDFANMDKIQDLALYESLNSGKPVTLREYVNAMPDGQQDIYFITAENKAKALASPALEVYRGKGYDVLLMTDPIDEWVMQTMMQYDKKKFKSVSKGELELDEASKKEIAETTEKAAKDYAELLKYVQTELGDKVSEVRFSGRLTDSPCCLVATEFGMNAHMEKILKSLDQQVPETKRILELNAKHPLIGIMSEELKTDAQSPALKSDIKTLYDQAVLLEGGELTDLADFTKRLTDLLVRAGSRA
ncbi:MAG: molecular chaperone HtpG [Victivallaceae bacterium]|nr:molecular chaperone HtpG [Victivallaceae bacterium]